MYRNKSIGFWYVFVVMSPLELIMMVRCRKLTDLLRGSIFQISLYCDWRSDYNSPQALFFVGPQYRYREYHLSAVCRIEGFSIFM